jgi:predicted N-acetyltransferase YhbS
LDVASDDGDRPVTEAFGQLEAADLPAITALCARSLSDAPLIDELERTLFAPEQPATVFGDPEVGLVATVAGIGGSAGQGYVRLLVVAPEHRERGVGRELLAVAEAELRAQGLQSVTMCEDAPFYLWPGVEARETALLCLLERLKYARTGANFNMDLDLTTIPADPGGWTVASNAERGEISEWAQRHWEWWCVELLRAFDRDTLVITRDADGIAAACAYDVNRTGWVGPVAVRPELMGRGVGAPALLGALHRMRAGGQTQVEIGWVGPVVPYARVGATVGRVFFTHRKALA